METSTRRILREVRGKLDNLIEETSKKEKAYEKLIKMLGDAIEEHYKLTDKLILELARIQEKEKIGR